MRNENPDAIIVDAADAVTLNQDVQWERCARLAAPASRGALDNLRTLSRAFASGHGAGRAPVNPALSDSEPYAGPFVRRVLNALVAIAAVEVVAGLALLPWAWGDYHRQHGEYAVWMTNLLVAHAATAGLLLLPDVVTGGPGSSGPIFSSRRRACRSTCCMRFSGRCRRPT